MSLSLSEDFYSVQAEGATTGVPSYFVRLRGCNLMCGNPNMKNVKDYTNQAEIEANKGDNASWVCDTMSVWMKGNKISNAGLMENMRESGQLENILKGDTHIIWTGGEPSLPQHREGIMDFMDYAQNFAEKGGFEYSPFSELETNGTLYVPDEDKVFLDKYIDQINCSPKLANSGMPEKRRVNLDAIKQINEHRNSYFKFVVGTENDVKEAFDTYVKPANVDKSKIILMPGLHKRENYHERGEFIYEMAKKYNVRAVNRGHISAWNMKTGV